MKTLFHFYVRMTNLLNNWIMELTTEIRTSFWKIANDKSLPYYVLFIFSQRSRWETSYNYYMASGINKLWDGIKISHLLHSNQQGHATYTYSWEIKYIRAIFGKIAKWLPLHLSFISFWSMGSTGCNYLIQLCSH